LKYGRLKNAPRPTVHKFVHNLFVMKRNFALQFTMLHLRILRSFPPSRWAKKLSIQGENFSCFFLAMAADSSSTINRRFASGVAHLS
jgi:hypothetical protein